MLLITDLNLKAPTSHVGRRMCASEYGIKAVQCMCNHTEENGIQQTDPLLCRIYISHITHQTRLQSHSVLL